MLPLALDAPDTGLDDDVDDPGSDLSPATSALRDLVLDERDVPSHPRVAAGDLEVVGGDVVRSAPELARLTLNVAQVHHDARAAGGRRLVYGGHTIGLAAAQVARALPGVVLFLAWESCDHLAPVHEGDTLRSTIAVESVEPWGERFDLVGLRSVVEGERGDQHGSVATVLDWKLTVLLRTARADR